MGIGSQRKPQYVYPETPVEIEDDMNKSKDFFLAFLN